MTATEILIPLVNPNEPEALLAAVYVKEGQAVTAGEPLCTLETTKATLDLTADRDGYVHGLRLIVGQSVQAGECLCYLASSPDWTPPTPGPILPQEQTTILPAGLRITRPALALAETAHLELAHLPLDRLVTEQIVREMLKASSHKAIVESPVDPTAILVYGGGGHGKALIDLIRALNTYHIVAVIDDSLSPGTQVMGVPVRGGSSALGEFYAQGARLAVNAVGGIGNLSARLKVFQQLENAGFTCPSMAHPSAVIEPSAHLAQAVQVMPRAYIGSEAAVGYGVIVNTGAIVSHDCQIGEYANLSPGAILAGEVEVGDRVLVGMGATINLRVKIGSRARVGNGATVKSDLPAGGIVRAGGIWPE